MFVSLCACLRDTNDLKLVFCLHFPTLLCRLLLYRWPTLLNYIVNDSSSLMMFAVSWAKKWVNAGLGVFGRVRFRLRQRGLPEKPKLWLGRRINEDRNRHSVKETKNSLSSEMQQVTFLCKIILTSKSSRGCSFQLFYSSFFLFFTMSCSLVLTYTQIWVQSPIEHIHMTIYTHWPLR